MWFELRPFSDADGVGLFIAAGVVAALVFVLALACSNNFEPPDCVPWVDSAAVVLEYSDGQLDTLGYIILEMECGE